VKVHIGEGEDTAVSELGTAGGQVVGSTNPEGSDLANGSGGLDVFVAGHSIDHISGGAGGVVTKGRVVEELGLFIVDLDRRAAARADLIGEETGLGSTATVSSATARDIRNNVLSKDANGHVVVGAAVVLHEDAIGAISVVASASNVVGISRKDGNGGLYVVISKMPIRGISLVLVIKLKVALLEVNGALRIIGIPDPVADVERVSNVKVKVIRAELLLSAARTRRGARSKDLQVLNTMVVQVGPERTKVPRIIHVSHKSAPILHGRRREVETRGELNRIGSKGHRYS